VANRPPRLSFDVDEKDASQFVALVTKARICELFAISGKRPLAANKANLDSARNP
jgi:hypothetical protein